MPNRRALLSVYDKTGVVDFARGVVELGYEVVSTGGTERALRDAGIPVIGVADLTGFPEMLDGRVKTLHPAIHAGLLARRDLPDHVDALDTYGILPISIVACNLYPFEESVRDPAISLDGALEQIDIGGPTMIRAAAKNFPHVLAVTDPADYPGVLDAIRSGADTERYRRTLAARAFGHVATYDTLISAYLREANAFPEELAVAGRRVISLRYGENPQQQAAAYRRIVPGRVEPGVLDAEQLGGKELSYNNVLDADAAWRAIRLLHLPAVSVVKHMVPCGLAQRDRLVDAYVEALAGDPISAFGGVIALNQAVDADTAKAISANFFEIVIAPGFSEEALQTLSRKRQLRILKMPGVAANGRLETAMMVRSVLGGLLVQEEDGQTDDPSSWTIVSKRPPTAEETAELTFAWTAVRHVRSNAIVMSRGNAIIGVGAGQPNRLASVRLAVSSAGSRAVGAVLASDAFFPFADGVETGLAAGVTAIVQPGGSVRDAEVIAAVDRAGAAMLFTGVRHFLH